MTTALIGHTGFVGSNLDAMTVFDAHYDERDVTGMAGKSFDLVVCVGLCALQATSGSEPEPDGAGFEAVTKALGAARVRELVLVSTTDVYPDPAAGGDEDTPIDRAANRRAHGRLCHELEQWALERLPSVRIVRVPALFGPGLSENALSDLLNRRGTEQINPAALFQWYPVSRLWADIDTARRHGLTLVNLVTEPVTMGAIIDRNFPGVAVGASRRPAPEYRIGTKHAAAFDGRGRFLMDADKTLKTIASFVADIRGIEAVKAGATS